MKTSVKRSKSKREPKLKLIRTTKKEREEHPERPYIVECCMGVPAFPTHTHGLTEIGMPEFIIDPLAFGPAGNCLRIDACYDYFMIPRNKQLLEDIKNGNTLKLKLNDMHPGKFVREDYVYCLRQVYPSFQAVKEAYFIEELRYLLPNAWFVQIYVEGDEFALTDDYYRDGVQW